MQSCRNGPEPVAARPAEGHGGLHGSGRDARNGKQRHGWTDPLPRKLQDLLQRAWSLECAGSCLSLRLLALPRMDRWLCRRSCAAAYPMHAWGDRRRPERHVPRQLTGSLALTLYRALPEPEQDCIYILYRLRSFHSQLSVSSRASLANNQV